VVLGSHGFLKGRAFTGYPGTETSVTGARFSTEAVVVDGNLVTSRGVGTAGAFALKLVEILVGAEAAARVAGEVLLA
jgi:4-methyl-5(b-hydroxyethyl)-thiazole monophosphate biosynthesis